MFAFVFHPAKQLTSAASYSDTIKRVACLALLLGVALTLPAYSQVSMLPTPTTQLPRATDTVRAVHLLYQDRRTGGLTLTLIGLPITAIFNLFTFTYIPSTGTTYRPAYQAENLVTGLVLGGLPAGAGISKLSRFSKAKEAALIASYQQGQPIPPAIRQRLTKKYFL